MDSFELREEIDHGGRKYFLQTMLVAQKGVIQSSFFKNGVLFDTIVRSVDGETAAEELRRLTKEAHVDNRRRFSVLLGVADRIKSSDDPKPHLRIAQALFRRHLFAEAVQEAQKAIQKGSTDSGPFMIMGESHFRMGDLQKAFMAVQKGLEISPEYPDLHNLMGEIHLSQKKCRAAIDSFSRAVNLNVYFGEPYLNLARAYLLNTIVKEDYELSRNADASFVGNLQRAAQLDPRLPAESIEQALRLFREKNHTQALEILDGLVQGPVRGGIDDIMLDLYLTLLHEGEDIDGEAVERYLGQVQEIIDHNPTFADGYNTLGILYTAKCKMFMDRASGAFKRALEINPNYAKAQKNLRLAENDRQGIFILLKALLD